MREVPILIIGAGPAGLSIAHELKLRGLDYLVLEKAAHVGNTFYSMTDSTTYGPWLNNLLPGSSFPKYKLLQRAHRGDYARYLSGYAHEKQLNVLTNVGVEKVEKEHGDFVVTTSEGKFCCHLLVNATGYFSNPFIPNYPGRHDSSLPQIHSAEYVSPKTISDLLGGPQGKILLVGKRLSAGEIMEELKKTGFELHLSHRSKIKFWPTNAQETLISPLLIAWENIALRLGAPKPQNLKPRMRRGAQKSLLDTGEVKKHPDIAEIHDRTVEFKDGSQETFDLILYATGYRPALKHLQSLLGGEKPKVKEIESVAVKNLFLLGYENARTFRSQFLRGIREDSRHLAELLQARLEEPIMTQVTRPWTQVTQPKKVDTQELTS